MKTINEIQSEQSHIKRHMESVRDEVQNKLFLDLPKGPLYPHPTSGFDVQDRISPIGTSAEILNDAYYSDFNSTAKSLAGWLKKWEKAAGAEAVAPYAEKLNALQSDLEAKKTELDELRDYNKQAKALKEQTAADHLSGPLAKCLESFRAAYVARQLSFSNMPDGKSYKESYFERETSAPFKKIWKTRIIKNGSKSWNRKKAQIIQAANASVDSYIWKLSGKIAKPIKSATITGELWSGSVLKVICTDGERQNWNTQCIENNRWNKSQQWTTYYYQWPTRRFELKN